MPNQYNELENAIASCKKKEIQRLFQSGQQIEHFMFLDFFVMKKDRPDILNMLMENGVDLLQRTGILLFKAALSKKTKTANLLTELTPYHHRSIQMSITNLISQEKENVHLVEPILKPLFEKAEKEEIVNFISGLKMTNTKVYLENLLLITTLNQTNNNSKKIKI